MEIHLDGEWNKKVEFIGVHAESCVHAVPKYLVYVYRPIKRPFIEKNVCLSFSVKLTVCLVTWTDDRSRSSVNAHPFYLN